MAVEWLSQRVKADEKGREETQGTANISWPMAAKMTIQLLENAFCKAFTGVEQVFLETHFHIFLTLHKP